MNTLAELPSAFAVITVSGLITIAVIGCIACRIITTVANTPDRTGLAACLKEIANVLHAIRRR